MARFFLVMPFVKFLEKNVIVEKLISYATCHFKRNLFTSWAEDELLIKFLYRQGSYYFLLSLEMQGLSFAL